MSEISNKIITISGEPRSGKSTVVKELIKKYQDLGFRVYLIETGKIFRERSQDEFAKMYPDRADANQAEIQQDEGFAEIRKRIDDEIDGWIEDLGKDINSIERPHDVYIIDSRLAWYKIPTSFAVRLTVDETIAGERALKDKSKGSQDSYDSIEDATDKTRQRKLGEVERYKERHKVDLEDSKNYNLIADTSYVNSAELADRIIQGETAYREGKQFPKMWASPAYFITSQRGQDTSDHRINALVNNMKTEGFDPVEGTVDVVQVGEAMCLKDGNHRCCAALSIGNTLVPYRVVAKDNEAAQFQFDEAITNQRCPYEPIYDWADMIEYRGGRLGNIEYFESFSVDKIISVRRHPELRKIFIDKKKTQVQGNSSQGDESR